LIGFSTGALVALKMSARLPERVPVRGYQPALIARNSTATPIGYS
jgi:hypothetical protein